ncbi:hypothetical protein LTR05_005292 [Lithohypha guttulata]|uniref:Aminotransferase class I/classII large domain-containing protein n=1 Tax=Lithohypha guttulata TaxID=1690604 RepID=A0AAN7SXH3_9EURO|nr:hypothetical protein LTR05_005292 [Lithohypha guttulata]
MALSKRGQEWADMSGDLLIWKIIRDLWDPETNPGGYVSLGVAENSLMHEELTKFIHENTKVPKNGLTYGDGGMGSKRLQQAMARFLTRKFSATVQIEPSHICITNGVTSAIEHLSNVLANPGDAILLGQPHYVAFIDDMQLRPGTEVVRISFHDVDPLSLGAIAAYEAAIKSCQANNQRVAAIMLCNPHNPLGRCYPRDFIIELMKLCQKYEVHLISDEIYAMSVFRSTDPSDPSVIPFTSLSSIPTEGLINPSLTHLLYGISKDFGANGLRIGCIVSQHNPELLKALIPLSIHSYASSLAESITATILSDNNFVDWYISENQKRLKANYDLVTAWTTKHNIEYAKGVNAAFFLWFNLGDVYLANQQKVKSAGQDKTTEEEVRVPQDPPAKSDATVTVDASKVDERTMAALIDQKIFLAAGTAFGSEKPGWFRIVYSQDQLNLNEGLRRIERALGLSSEI